MQVCFHPWGVQWRKGRARDCRRPGRWRWWPRPPPNWSGCFCWAVFGAATKSRPLRPQFRWGHRWGLRRPRRHRGTPRWTQRRRPMRESRRPARTAPWTCRRAACPASQSLARPWTTSSVTWGFFRRLSWDWTCNLADWATTRADRCRHRGRTWPPSADCCPCWTRSKGWHSTWSSFF